VFALLVVRADDGLSFGVFALLVVRADDGLSFDVFALLLVRADDGLSFGVFALLVVRADDGWTSPKPTKRIRRAPIVRPLKANCPPIVSQSSAH